LRVSCGPRRLASSSGKANSDAVPSPTEATIDIKLPRRSLLYDLREENVVQGENIDLFTLHFQKRPQIILALVICKYFTTVGSQLGTFWMGGNGLIYLGLFWIKICWMGWDQGFLGMNGWYTNLSFDKISNA
ncbi:hypothetical protein ACJX0J_024270, partial [Zea mays]